MSERKTTDQQETRLTQHTVITAEQYLQAAEKLLAAAREQIALGQRQVLQVQEQVTSATTAQAQKAQPLAVSVAAAAEALGVNSTTMYRLLMSGELKSVRIGRRRIVPIKALEEFIERGLEAGF